MSECQWFYNCHNLATTTREGAQFTDKGIELKPVLICDRCNEKVSRIER